MSGLDNTGIARFKELAESVPNGAYHLAELEIALTPADPRHYLPSIPIGAKVLDIGCGAGQTLMAACPYQVTGEGGQCLPCSRESCPTWGYGVDIDEDAVALGRAWSRRLVLIQGNAARLPYGDDEFDMVISRVALIFVDMQEAVAEMRRVLRPGGKIWLGLHPFSMVFSQVPSRSWKGLFYLTYVAINGLFFTLTLGTFSLFHRREYWQTGSAMRRILSKAGFRNINVQRGPKRLIVSAEL
ncbi:MAG: class I SAM-dependent methyltransferase [Bryobacteraceae bacterium]